MNYKRLCIFMVGFIVLLSTLGCDRKVADEVSINKETQAEKSISHSYTSSDEDIVHEKLIFQESEWVYYINSSDSSALYKRNMDGSKNLKIRDSYYGAFCLDGDWIYYSEYDDNSSLYRIKTDGSVKEKLNNDDTSSINVSKEWVYYKNLSDNGKLYKVRKDGSERTKLCEDSVWSIYVAGGDWIYYTNSSEDNCIYMIGMDGKERTKITNASSYNFCVSEGWIYYVTGETETVNYPQIYKIKRDGTEKTHLKNGEPYELFSDFAVLGDYIYYDTYNSDDILYRIRTDGTKLTRISTEGEHINSLNVSKNDILFNSTFYNLNICKMNLESKKETIIDKPPVYDKKHLA